MTLTAWCCCKLKEFGTLMCCAAGEAAGEFENTGCTNADAVAMHPEHLVLAVGGHSIKDSSGKVQWLKVFAPKASKI